LETLFVRLVISEASGRLLDERIGPASWPPMLDKKKHAVCHRDFNCGGRRHSGHKTLSQNGLCPRWREASRCWCQIGRRKIGTRDLPDQAADAILAAY
jgi:hypothetical protein